MQTYLWPPHISAAQSTNHTSYSVQHRPSLNRELEGAVTSIGTWRAMSGLHSPNSHLQIVSNGFNKQHGGPPRQRRVHHKVKTGCKACKVRRQKCDERKPVCSGCKRHSTDCLYQIQKCPKARKGSCFSSQQTADQSLHSPPQNSLPISPSSELDIGDLELLHQFLTFTCKATAQLPEVTAQVQRSILPMAQAYPFVMRGVLAMAAIHLSRLRPSRQEHYAMMAAQHHSKAFPEFQSALQNITEENCHALISFSKRLLWCSMAREESSDGRRVASKGADSWLPSWFHLLRGSCYLVEFARPWIEGDVNICPPAESPVDYSETSAHQQVVSLMSELLPMAQSTSCETVLTALQESFARAAMRHQNTPYRHAINFWVGSLPDDYVESLQKKEPWALVVLAHFCVLFHRSETVWFMRGHAMRLMLSITECLDPSWKRFIQWPCEELGIERSWDRNADASMTEL